jgi:putative transposase
MKRYLEGQAMASVRQQEAGITIKGICPEMGISEATFCNWKSKYGSMEASDVQRLKELGPKMPSAMVCMQRPICKTGYLKACLKKALKPQEKRESVGFLVNAAQPCNQRGCKLMGISLTTCQYKVNQTTTLNCKTH